MKFNCHASRHFRNGGWKPPSCRGLANEGDTVSHYPYCNSDDAQTSNLEALALASKALIKRSKPRRKTKAGGAAFCIVFFSSLSATIGIYVGSHGSSALSDATTSLQQQVTRV